MIIPAINKVAEEYRTVSEETLTQESFSDLLRNGVNNLHKRLDAVVEDDLKKMKNKFILESSLQYIAESLKPLELALDNLHAVKVSSRSNLTSLELEWSDFSIVNGSGVIDHEALKRRCELRIESEDQLTLYNHYQALKREYNLLKEFLVSKGFDSSRSCIISSDGRGLMYEDMRCNLIIPEDSLDLWIFKQLKSK